MALDWEFKLKAPWGDESIILGQSNPLDPDEIGSIVPKIYIAAGIGLPNSCDVDVNFKDIIGTPLAEGYENFTFQGNFSYLGTINGVSSLGNNIFPGDNTFLPYTNGISGTLRINVNPSLYIVGHSASTLVFKIYGTNSSTSQVELLDTRYVYIQLEKLVNDTPILLPKYKKVAHTKYATEAPLQYTIYSKPTAEIKLMVLKKGFSITDTPTIEQIQDYPNEQPAYVLYSGEAHTFDVNFLPYIDTLEPLTTSLIFSLSTLNNIGVFEVKAETTLDLEILQNDSYSNLIFNAVKNFKEALPQTAIVPELTGTVTKLIPTWITYDEANNTYLPLSTNQMEVGTHIGIVYFLDENENELFRINITYIISDYISTDYQDKDRAFTLDPKFLNLNTANTNSYYQVNTTLKIFEFYTNLETEYTLNEKYIPFKGKEKFNVGRTIHRLMSNFQKLFQMDEQYFRAEIIIEAIEKNLTTNAVIRTDISDTIYFIAGLSRNQDKIGILDFNPLDNRVTVNSVAILNYIIPEGNFEIRVKKNGTVSNNIAISNHNIIASKLLTFENFQKGDIISYEVYDLDADETFGIVKQFKVFPSGQFSYIILWQDEFLLQKVIECTGDLLLKSDFESVTMKNYLDLAENLTIIDNSKDCKLTINTGWLLQSDVDTIESLMRSKRIWISSDADKDTTGISLSYTGKSMVNIDKQRELVDYTLEFTINKTYNEETFAL